MKHENVQHIFSIDKCKRRTTCLEDTTVLNSVDLKVGKLTLLAIHPQNDTYPLFTFQISNFGLYFGMHVDHDSYRASVDSFKILDHTMSPNTLDPSKDYKVGSMLKAQQIVTSSSSDSLSFEHTSYHFPMDFCCPKQENKTYAGLFKLRVKQVKIYYVHEQFFRLSDYFLYQFMESLSDTNPYELIIQKLKEEIDPFTLSDGLEGERVQTDKLDRLLSTIVDEGMG